MTDRKELAQRLWQLSHRTELRVDPFEPGYSESAQEKWLYMADVAIGMCGAVTTDKQITPNTECTREKFESHPWFSNWDFSRFEDKNAVAIGTYSDPRTSSTWDGFKAGYAAALQSLPRFTEEELVELAMNSIAWNELYSYGEGRPPSMVKVVRAIIEAWSARMPHIVKEGK